MNSPATTRPALPPLKDGDRLTREEIERRYEAMPDLKKAELIDGIVHMPSPVRQECTAACTSTSSGGWPSIGSPRPA